MRTQNDTKKFDKFKKGILPEEYAFVSNKPQGELRRGAGGWVNQKLKKQQQKTCWPSLLKPFSDIREV